MRNRVDLPPGRPEGASLVPLSWSGVEELEAALHRLGLPLQLLQLEGGNLAGGGWRSGSARCGCCSFGWTGGSMAGGRLLLGSDPDQVRIGTIAADWGFLNAGHFARDYRLLFGERPRDTLSHRRQAC